MIDALIVGCGYLGQQVAQLLIEQGLRVAGTTRSPERASALQKRGIVPLLADVLDPQQVEQLPVAPLVLHCVGYDRTAAASMRQVYVEGLDSILARLATGRGRLVYASSTGVYAQRDGSWVDEQSPAQPESASGRVCLEAEDRVRRFHNISDWQAVILRLSGLYGPGRIPNRDRLLRAELIPSDPDHWLNLIHIHDAARCCMQALLAAGFSPLYVACDDQPARRREFYEHLARLLGTSPPAFEANGGGRRDGSNKRASNRLIKSQLGIQLDYPSYREGLAHAISGP